MKKLGNKRILINFEHYSKNGNRNYEPIKVAFRGNKILLSVINFVFEGFTSKLVTIIHIHPILSKFSNKNFNLPKYSIFHKFANNASGLFRVSF